MTDRLPELIAQLRGLDNVSGVRPVRARIGRSAYPGAVYADASFVGERYYLLGALPASYRRSARTCYRLNGRTDDWYVACYSDRPAEVLPDLSPARAWFGPWFMLCRWTCDGAIDAYALHQCTRVDASVEEVQS